MAENQSNLKDWRKSKGWRQEDLADKLGEPRPTYQSWETGRTPSIPPEVQGKLRKLGYKGPWPAQAAQDAVAEPAAPYVTEAQLAEWRGYWRAGMEAVLKRLDDLEDQVRKLRQHGAS